MHDFYPQLLSSGKMCVVCARINLCAVRACINLRVQNNCGTASLKHGTFRSEREGWLRLEEGEGGGNATVCCFGKSTAHRYRDVP